MWCIEYSIKEWETCQKTLLWILFFFGITTTTNHHLYSCADIDTSLVELIVKSRSRSRFFKIIGAVAVLSFQLEPQFYQLWPAPK